VARRALLSWGAQAASLQQPAACRLHLGRHDKSRRSRSLLGKLPRRADWQPALPRNNSLLRSGENSRSAEGGLLCSNAMTRLLVIAFTAVFLLLGDGTLNAAAMSSADSILRKTASFALGGVGVAGTISEGERALREVLKQSDAVAQLEVLLPEASGPGQLYALLGLRVRDRDAYRRALVKYGQRDASVQTMRGCILQQEPFSALVKQIDHGDYDSFLSRSWPEHAH